MQLHLDNVNMHTNIELGDIIAVTHKGMGQTEAFIIANPPLDNCGYIALSIEDGQSILNGEFYSIESLIEDVRTSGLFDRIFHFNKEEYMLSIERI